MLFFVGALSAFTVVQMGEQEVKIDFENEANSLCIAHYLFSCGEQHCTIPDYSSGEICRLGALLGRNDDSTFVNGLKKFFTVN